MSKPNKYAKGTAEVTIRMIKPAITNEAAEAMIKNGSAPSRKWLKRAKARNKKGGAGYTKGVRR